jgi:replicative DNA helicase
MGTASAVLDALRPHGLKANGGNQYHANAVWRNGDSFGVSLRIDDEETGVYYDHVAGTGGTLYDIADLLGIEHPSRGGYRASSSGRTYDSLNDYAAAHGIPDGAAVFVEAGWTANVVTHKGRPALEFKTASGSRWRYIDDKKPKYDSPSGYKSCWYGLIRALKIAKDGFGALVITNGEPSVVVAQYYGIPAACVTSGENSMTPELVAELDKHWNGPVWVVYDNDAAGRNGAQKVKSLCPRAQIVTIWSHEDDGADLADFCNLYRKESPGRLKSIAAKAPAADNPTPGLPSIDMRKLQELAQTLRRAASQPNSPEQIIIDAATQVRAAVDQILLRTQAVKSLSAADVVGKAFEEAERARTSPDPIRGRRSPFPELDRRTLGFMPSDLWCILGHTGAGKSWFAASLVAHFVRQKMRGYIVTTEMLAHDWARRVASYIACVPSDKFESGRATDADMERFSEALVAFSETKSVFNDTPSPTIEALGMALEAAHKEQPLDYILIDSAMRLTTSGTTEMVQRHMMIAEWLLSIAKAYSVPVIFTAQAGRNSKDRSDKRPEVWDIAFSSAYEQNSTHVLGLYRPGMFDEMLSLSSEAEINILKDRRCGNAGVRIAVMSVVNQGWYPLQNN